MGYQSQNDYGRRLKQSDSRIHCYHVSSNSHLFLRTGPKVSQDFPNQPSPQTEFCFIKAKLRLRFNSAITHAIRVTSGGVLLPLE